MSYQSGLQRLSLTSNHLSAVRPLSIGSVDVGSKYSSSYKKYAVKDGKIVSFFHDVPLELDAAARTANMVVEVPRWSNAKFEISTSELGNPIKQDVKKGQVRFINNIFPHKGYIHNYGAFPQTWEDVTDDHGALKLFGDNDPLDVCEIGSQVLETGDVVQVKILGALAMIDDGELDWKVIAINTQDPVAAQVSSLADVESHFPGYLQATREWFRNYKIPEGKGANSFAHDEQYQDAGAAVAVVQHNHESWRRLIAQKVGPSDKLPEIANTSVENSPGFASDLRIAVGAATSPTPIPPHVHRSHFLNTVI